MASTFLALIFTAIMWVAAGRSSDGESKKFVTVECKANTVGQLGQKTLLVCVIKTSPEVDNPIIDVITWKKDEEVLLLYAGAFIKQKPGYRLADHSWNETNMNVSLIIENTSLADAGKFNCEVNTDSGDNKGTINLQVTARYNKPVIRSKPEKINRESGGVLICDAYGGYPEGQIRWFDEAKKDGTKSSQMTVHQTSTGLFHLSSELSLLRGSKYTCVVFTASGGKEDEAIFEVDPMKDGSIGERETGTAPKIVAPVVVIGSLIVGLLLVMLVRSRRSKRNNLQAVPVHYSDAEGGGND